MLFNKQIPNPFNIKLSIWEWVNSPSIPITYFNISHDNDNLNFIPCICIDHTYHWYRISLDIKTHKLRFGEGRLDWPTIIFLVDDPSSIPMVVWDLRQTTSRVAAVVPLVPTTWVFCILKQTIIQYSNRKPWKWFQHV